MKFYKKLFLISITIFSYSCKEIEEFSIQKIVIPPYYHNYEYRKFWETQGVSFTFSPKRDYKGEYKDSVSTNFLRIGEMHTDLLFLDLEKRVEFLKNEMGVDTYSINKDFEIYESRNTEYLKKPLYRVSTIFLIKKDSVCFSVGYETFDNDPKKIKDYNNIINEIKSKCKNGTSFKSTLKRLPRGNAIAN